MTNEISSIIFAICSPVNNGLVHPTGLDEWIDQVHRDAQAPADDDNWTNFVTSSEAYWEALLATEPPSWVSDEVYSRAVGYRMAA